MRRGEGARQREEKEASAEQEEGARPGRGIYIFFMILFNLTRLAAVAVLLSGAALWRMCPES